MKTLNLGIVLAVLAILPSAQAQRGTLQFGERITPPPQPPPIWESENPPEIPPLPSSGPASAQPIAARPALVTPEQAITVIKRFSAAYPKMGSPRFLICVSRELADEQSDGKSSGSTGGSSVKGATDGKPQPTPADQQAVRDVERLFARPLRSAGVTLADPKVASQLIADKPLDDIIGSSNTPQSRKDREALGKIADAVIEILVSSKNVTVPRSSGAQTIAVPDIQATVISLKDSKILGQASSADVTMRVPPASLGNYGVREIAEGTALVLMEDMAGDVN